MAQEVDVGALTCGMPNTTQRKLIAKKMRRQTKRHCANRQCHTLLNVHNPDRLCSLCKQARLESKTTGDYHLADRLEPPSERNRRLRLEAEVKKLKL